MSLKILLADDNINAQRMGSKILTDAGHEVVAVSNGAAALKKMAATKPDLLILDVYMPGYTGLEVCEKIKNAPETAALPAILTVTNMEPFNPEDGKRVKADGVMVKPFEASDLLAMVQKIESKLKSQPASEYVDTVKMAAAPEFKDASYEEWKAEAPPTAEMTVEAEQPVAATVSVPQEMASAPALGLEDMFSEAAPTPAAVAEAQPAPAMPAYEAAPGPMFDLETAAAAAPAIAPPAELEFTSAPQVGAIEVASAPELEITAQEEAAAVPVVRDPALVTDAADMAQFVTKFGAAEPEEISAGVAPEPPSPTAAGEAPVEESPLGDVLAPAPQQPSPVIESSTSSLEEEMRRAFETAAADVTVPAPTPEPVLEAAPAIEAIPEFSPAAMAAPPPAPKAVPTQPPATPDALTAQFAAELEQVADVGPTAFTAHAAALVTGAAAAPAKALDEQRIAEAVERVLARYKRELVDAVKLELEK